MQEIKKKVFEEEYIMKMYKKKMYANCITRAIDLTLQEVRNLIDEYLETSISPDKARLLQKIKLRIK